MQPQGDFPGGVFSAEIDGGRAGALVSFTAGALCAVTADGQLFRLPFAACRIERGGASDRMWFCRSADRALTIFSEAPGFAQALSEAARRELGPQIERLLGEQAAERGRHGRRWATALVALLVLGGGVYLGLRQAGRASIALLPRSVDRKLGDLARDNMSLGGRVMDDPVLTRAVDEIVQRLAKNAGDGFAFRVQVVDAPTVNAFALPGGAIVVYTGLLRVATAPEQVAGVLAHEMAHVVRRHGMQRIAQSVGIVACVQVLFGDVTGIAAVGVQVLEESAINSYSREHEHQADMDGVATLAASGVDPRALADVFALLQKEQAGALQLPAFLASHPDLKLRVDEVRGQAGRSGFKRAAPFALSWAEVQAHAGASPR